MADNLNRSQKSHFSSRSQCFLEFDSVTRIIDYYQYDPHLCLTKVQDFIDSHPEVYHTERHSLRTFEQRFLEGLSAPKSEVDLAVLRIKEAQKRRALLYKKPDYDMRPCLRVTNRVPQKYVTGAEITVTNPKTQKEQYDLNIKLGGLVKRRLSSRGEKKPKEMPIKQEIRETYPTSADFEEFGTPADQHIHEDQLEISDTLEQSIKPRSPQLVAQIEPDLHTNSGEEVREINNDDFEDFDDEQEVPVSPEEIKEKSAIVANDEVGFDDNFNFEPEFEESVKNEIAETLEINVDNEENDFDDDFD